MIGFVLEGHIYGMCKKMKPHYCIKLLYIEVVDILYISHN
jgi:hypothetical protein